MSECSGKVTDLNIPVVKMHITEVKVYSNGSTRPSVQTPLLSMNPSLECKPDKCDFESVIFFGNPRSGSRKACKFLKMNAEKVVLVYPEYTVELYIYNLLDIDHKTQGMKKLKEIADLKPVRVIAGGGDGTPAWVLHELLIHHVNLNHVYFINLPFGTVNVFARNLGWGHKYPNKLSETSLHNLRGIVRDWLIATPIHYDFWNISIELQQDGYIETNKKTVKGIHAEQLKDSNGDNIKILKKTMCNFFDIGFVGKVGWDVEKRRSKRKECNICWYALCGVKNLMARLPRVSDFTSSIISYESGQEIVIFDKKKDLLNHSTTVLMALNAKTYGIEYPIWDQSKIWKREQDQSFEPQSVTDGKIELLAVPALGLKKETKNIFHSPGTRLHQGRGPFKINFDTDKKDLTIYVNVDGEYLKLYKPKAVTLSIAEEYRDLKVLVNDR